MRLIETAVFCEFFAHAYYGLKNVLIKYPPSSGHLLSKFYHIFTCNLPTYAKKFTTKNLDVNYICICSGVSYCRPNLHQLDVGKLSVNEYTRKANMLGEAKSLDKTKTLGKTIIIGNFIPATYLRI